MVDRIINLFRSRRGKKNGVLVDFLGTLELYRCGAVADRPRLLMPRGSHTPALALDASSLEWKAEWALSRFPFPLAHSPSIPSLCHEGEREKLMLPSPPTSSAKNPLPSFDSS